MMTDCDETRSSIHHISGSISKDDESLTHAYHHPCQANKTHSFAEEATRYLPKRLRIACVLRCFSCAHLSAIGSYMVGLACHFRLKYYLTRPAGPFYIADREIVVAPIVVQELSADLFVVLMVLSTRPAIIACVTNLNGAVPLATSHHVQVVAAPRAALPRRNHSFNSQINRSPIQLRSRELKIVNIICALFGSISAASMAPRPRPGSSLLLLAARTLLMTTMMLLCRRAGAVEHVVGDDEGWDSGVNYAAWARKHTFAVGDVLVFQYVSSQHNAYQVTESAYRSCDAAAALVKHTSGYDKVVLAEAKTYWFICEVPGHCLGGMKLAVNVSGAPGGLSPIAAPPMPPTGSASAAASLAGGCRGWLAVGLALGVLVELMSRATTAR